MSLEDIPAKDPEVQKCECGWPMPICLRAFPNDAEPVTGNEIPLCYVAIICPVCQSGHLFYNPDEPESVATMQAEVEKHRLRQS